VWTVFVAGVMIGAGMAGLAVLVLAIADGDLLAPFRYAPMREYSLVPPGWVPFGFAAGFAIVTWSVSALALRASLLDRARAAEESPTRR